jgi:phosphatidylinositol-3-phosphatase
MVCARANIGCYCWWQPIEHKENYFMKLRLAAAFGLAACAASNSFAATGPVPTGIPRLEHVFVIVMENHGYAQIANNPNTPFINAYMKSSNLATNYFGVAHPSLTNYLEITGGSNFNILSDSNSDWHNATCKTNLETNSPDNEMVGAPVCPIAGIGTDAATPVRDLTNETSGAPGDIEIDDKASSAIPAAKNILGISIADQLSANGLTWKSYQQSLPVTGADGVSISDGEYTDKTDFSKIKPVLKPALSSSNIVALYASKHNPFVYFKSGQTPAALKRTVGFDQLYTDLSSGDVPSLSFIVPNQCDDQHGQSNGTAFCNFDPDDNGSQGGLNPALIQAGDQAIQRLVTAIHASPAWKTGRAAIVMVWDENDYFHAPESNKVVLTVDKNYGKQGKTSALRYTHFSLLRSLESAFILPCLNHACDANVPVMSDLFAAK